MRVQTDSATHTTQQSSLDVNERFGLRDIKMADLREALRRGMDDFFASPTHGVFLTIIYLLIAAVAAIVGLGENPLPLIFPLIAGAALIGPLAACGLYELSRRRENGQNYAWWHVFDVFRTPSRWAIAGMGAILALLFVAWMLTAAALYGTYFGAEQPASMRALLEQVLTTTAGWQMLMSGVFIGFFYSAVVYVATVVSLPLMIHHKVGLPEAVGLSISAVLRNWRPMVAWYFLVVALMILGSLPLLLGLAIVVPVLGHATWHLYRRVCQSGTQ